MAIGTNSFDNNGALVFLAPRTKDKQGNPIPPHFTVSRVVDKKITLQSDTVTFVSGNLTKVEVKERTSEKFGTTNEAILYFKDNEANETYRVSLPFRMSSRSLFNGLANLDTFDNVKVSYYTTKKGYDAYYLTQNGVKVEWKFSFEQMPEPPVVKFKGKDMKDYTPVDDFFKTSLLELAQRISGKAEQVETVAATNADKDESVPF